MLPDDSGSSSGFVSHKSLFFGSQILGTFLPRKILSVGRAALPNQNGLVLLPPDLPDGTISANH